MKKRSISKNSQPKLKSANKQLDRANDLLTSYEQDMQSLWKQRDQLITENTEYELKNQHLDEELRLVM